MFKFFRKNCYSQVFFVSAYKFKSSQYFQTIANSSIFTITGINSLAIQELLTTKST